jgi:hypothetical protein
MLDQVFSGATRWVAIARRSLLASRPFADAAKMGRAFDALIGMAKGVGNALRRADERRRLTGLSDLERHDLGHHRVRHELTKWPWQH